MAVRTVQEVVLKRQACENNKKRMNIIKVRNWLKTLILMWSVPALLIGIWIYLSMTNQLNHLFPRPSELIQTTASLIADGTLAANIQISLLRAGAGLAAGGTIGFVLWTLTGQFRLFDTILNTPIQMIKSVPRLAILPLILIWFGLGETAKVVLIALSTFFPVYLNTFHGIRSIDPELLEMGKVYGLTPWELFRHIIFPGAVSSIMIGLRQSIGGTWLILIVAETVAAQSGIGFMATNAREFMMMDVVVLSMIVYALLGTISDWLAVRLTRRLLRWNTNMRRSES